MCRVVFRYYKINIKVLIFYELKFVVYKEILVFLDFNNVCYVVCCLNDDFCLISWVRVR